MARTARKAPPERKTPPKLKLVDPPPPWERMQAKAAEETTNLLRAISNCVAHVQGMANRLAAVENLLHGLARNLGKTEERVSALGTLTTDYFGGMATTLNRHASVPAERLDRIERLIASIQTRHEERIAVLKSAMDEIVKIAGERKGKKNGRRSRQEAPPIKEP